MIANLSSSRVGQVVTSSGNSTSAIPPSQSPDSRISTIRKDTLETIQVFLPLSTLFTPELKIDLGVFIKDQTLIHRIAQRLSTFNGTADVESITKYFEGSDLLAEITSLFKQDPSAYLKFFYEACVDVINKKTVEDKIKSALEGRIFTLKNALVAQKNPGAISASQKSCHIAVHEAASIQAEGASFIREVLAIHIKFQHSKHLPFRDLLVLTAEQLIPFVRKVTRSYLLECGKTCPDNPLTFRNPTGYNHHGLVAATVMETCLNALGYQTRLLSRSDLEPKVSLATAHNVVEVIDNEGTKYLVDPSYIQFHKDICLDDSLLPKDSVLILQESEVDEYIEKNLMGKWRVSREAMLRKDDMIAKKIMERDHLLAIMPDIYALDPEFLPANPELWARKSFKRIWDLSSYQQIFSDVGYQDLFVGDEKYPKTNNLIKAMEIGGLTHHLSFHDVEKRLMEMSKEPKLKAKNSIEALYLIAQLPTRARQAAFSSLLDLDLRIDPNIGLGILLNAYYRSLRNVVNPEGKDKTVIYGCSGADSMTSLLAIDAKDYIFVDLTPATLDEFNKSLQLLIKLDPESDKIRTMLESSHRFLTQRARLGGATSAYKGNGQHVMESMPLKLLFDLHHLGVKLEDVVINSIEGGKGIKIIFPWKYYGQTVTRKRTLTFLTGDITKPVTYPETLKHQIKGGFDIFYMKAAFFAPLHYPTFIPTIGTALKNGGWLMTSDKTFTMEHVNPTECLKENKVSFTNFKNKEIKILEQLLNPQFDPMVTIPQLIAYPDKRQQRMSGSDTTYWSILNLRQKN